MGYTNTTTHYELPQYVATDKPKYLTDFNETMVAIDTQMYANAQAAATADGKAVAAKDVADGAVSSIGTLNAQINGDPTDPSDTGLAGEVSGIVTDLNTVQSLIGSGTPTTSNQTIIGAINGLEGAVAPREDGDDLANSYSTGEQFARGGSVYKALTSLTAGTAFASLTLNTDYKVADTLVKQISDNAGSLDALLDELSDQYVFEGLSEVAHTLVTNATYAETLEAMQSEMLAALEALDDDEMAIPVQIKLANNFHSIQALFMATNQGTYTNYNVYGSNMSISYVNGSIYLQSCEMSHTSAYNKYSRIIIALDGTITGADLSSETAPAGNYATVLAKFKKI